MYSNIFTYLASPIFYVAFALSKPLLELNQYADSMSCAPGNKAEWIANTNANLNLHEGMEKQIAA